MLTLDQLTLIHRGRIVLDALDLRVAPREIVALVGPEHAGKTTALECFLGLHTPATGHASIDGIHVTGTANATAVLVASVPAQLSLPRDARVLSHVRNSCLRLGRRIPDPVLCATLARNGVSAACHDSRIGDCAPAVQRHLALTLAWLTNAPALLIDDPTRGVGPIDIDTLVVNLRGLRKGDRAILLATRDLPFARRIATRIVLLDRGSIVETYDPNASRRTHEAGSYLTALVG